MTHQDVVDGKPAAATADGAEPVAHSRAQGMVVRVVTTGIVGLAHRSSAAARNPPVQGAHVA